MSAAGPPPPDGPRVRDERAGGTRGPLRPLAAPVRRLGGALGRAAGPLRILTPAGRAVAVTGLAAALVAAAAGWVEACAIACCCAVVLLVALAQVAVPSPHAVSLRLSNRRVVAGQTAIGEIAVTNRRARRAGAGVIELPIGSGAGQILVPPLAGHETWNEVFSVVTRRRGLIRIGPAHAVRADALGLVRRVSTWDNPETLHVHPRTVRVPFEATGFQLDVEGVVTAKLSSSDVAFHALRDYEPGDDRRHVHWASSARLGRLVVRQFEETRRSHHLLVLDTRGGAWPRDDFETAVSVAASLALADMTRSRTVWLRGRAGWLPTSAPVGLMDALAELEPDDAGADPLADVVRRAVAEHPDLSALTVVVGPDTDDEEATGLLAPAGPDVAAGVLRIRTGAVRRRLSVERGSLVDCPSVEDLPHLLLLAGTAS
ncbi:DUF58 domain-containing protein [Actinomyces sp. oral taxon 414]|uniref:DUF58 domain-containing protein n=1 Tax=Actinomyces sp. oral taxon 414 TaxID=712122 RepID=UPI0009FACE9D|nr:DUF58 domain-containing protein [Actinomyces sp. oral taxon 414]